jgi:hypothetical protein
MNKMKNSKLGKSNYIVMCASITIITIAYFIMALGDVSISPLLLIIAYAILIPLSLLLPVKKNDRDS